MAVSTRGAWRDWLGFFLHGVAQQARDATRRAQRLQDLQTKWRPQLTQAHASIFLLRWMDSLFESPLLTIPMAQGLLRVTYHSAQRNVEKLGQAGIMRQVGERAYGKVFIAVRILQVMQERDAWNCSPCAALQMAVA
jgi:Fic family protein